MLFYGGNYILQKKAFVLRFVNLNNFLKLYVVKIEN